MPEATKTSGSRVVSIRVPEVLAQKWDAYAQQHGKSPAEAYKLLMQYMLAENITEKSASQMLRSRGVYRQVDQSDGRPKERLEVRFTQQELEAIRHAAEQEGSSAQQFVVCSVRAALTHEPQYTLEPAKALWAACTELRAIGRNINQIAKRLNEADFDAAYQLQITFLEKLEQDIRVFTSKVARLQSASIERWGLRRDEGIC